MSTICKLDNSLAGNKYGAMLSVKQAHEDFGVLASVVLVYSRETLDQLGSRKYITGKLFTDIITKNINLVNILY